MTGLPDWLRRRLEATGHLDSDGVHRAVRSSRHGCGATVLVGLDADRCALAAVVDPWPVDVTGELLAVLGDRATYDLVGHGRVELVHRDDFHVRGPRRWPVVAEHRCGAPRLPSDPDPPAVVKMPAAVDLPPF